MLGFVLHVHIILVACSWCVYFVCFVDKLAFFVANYQLGWDSRLLAALPCMCFIWSILVHLVAVCKVVMPKKGTTTTISCR